MANGSNNVDIIIERSNDEIFSKYGITMKTVQDSAVEAFTNEPFNDWILPFDIERKQNGMNSLLSQFTSACQEIYLNKFVSDGKNSANKANVTIYPGTECFVCFAKVSDETSNESSDETKYEYAGSITVCSPVVDAGYNEIETFSYMGPFIKDLLYKFPFYFFYSFIPKLVSFVLNQIVLYHKIEQNKEYFGSGFWLMEMVHCDKKFRGCGIGSSFINYIFNQHINKCVDDQTMTNVQSGFVILNVANERSLRFYQKHGFKIVTQFEFEPVYNQSGEKVECTLYFVLWHKDEILLDKAIKALNIDKKWKFLTVGQSLKQLMFPNWMVDVPFTPIVVVMIIAAWLVWFGLRYDEA